MSLLTPTPTGVCAILDGGMQRDTIGLRVRVVDATTGADLGVASVPFPVVVGDAVAVAGEPHPYIVDAVRDHADADTVTVVVAVSAARRPVAAR